jgi:hypothetical protein
MEQPEPFISSRERDIRELDIRTEALQQRLASMEEKVSGHRPAVLPWTWRVELQFAGKPFDADERLRAVNEEITHLEDWMARLDKITAQKDASGSAGD